MLQIRMPIALVAIGLTCAGCVTQSAGGSPPQQSSWQIDAAVQKCLGAAVLGAGLGAVLGAATGGGRGAAYGAGAGAIAGGATCAVITALDAQDRERIRMAQLEAVRTGRNQDMAYAGSDGLQRQVSVAPRPVPPPPPAARPAKRAKSAPVAASEASSQVSGPICRTVDTSAAIASKGVAEIPPQTFCRSPNGDWEPVSDPRA